MEKYKIIFACLLLSFLFTACFEDEGNYDYTDLQQPDISGLTHDYSIPLGEEYKLEPTIDYKGADENDFTYLWVRKGWETNGMVGVGDTISREKTLAYRFLEVETYNVAFVVTNKKTGISAMKIICLGVVPAYQTGWIILSDQNSKSVLSYVRKDSSIVDGVKYPYTAISDIYTQNYAPDELGSLPVGLGRHFGSGGDQILVIQKGGKGSVELNGNNFEKVITTREEFIGAQYPADFVPRQAEYGQYLEVFLSEDGNLYNRIRISSDFQTCRYSHIPMSAEKGAKISYLHYSPHISYFYMYDELNHRMLAMRTDPQMYAGQVVYIKMNPEGKNAPEFTPLDHLGADTKLMYCGSYSDGSQQNYVQILKKGSDYYLQTFNMESGMGSKVMYVSNGKEERFAGNTLVSDRTKYCVTGSTYLFFGEKDVLYYYDRDLNRAITYATFEGTGDITVIEPNPDRRELGIGLSSGEFYIVDVKNEVLASGKPHFLLKIKGLGTVVDVDYKYGSEEEFNNAK